MKRLFQVLLLCAGLLCSAGLNSVRAQAVTENIEWDSLADFILNPNGTKAAVGDTVLLGLFPTAFNFSANQTFSSLSAAFTQLDSTTIASAGQFSKSFVQTTGGFEGKELYVWAFNNATPSSASAWAIVTNTASNWKVPNDGGNTVLDTSDVGVFVPTGARGLGIMPSMFTGAPNNTDWEMTTSIAAVPEPSTFAMGALGVVGLLAVARRRKK